jgi:hypothetical protein
MCFSAGVSFTLAGVLAGIGATSVSRSTPGTSRIFAATPLVFAAQQAAEGTVWLTMDGDAHGMVHRAAIIAFLGVAMVVWPAWAPLAFQRMEQDSSRRRVLSALSLFGAAVAAGGVWLLAQAEPIAMIAGHSIRYDYAGAENPLLHASMVLAYLIPTTAPVFLSTTRLSRVIGGVLVASIVLAGIVEREAFTSVWCFFAAILSSLILVAVRRNDASHTVARRLPTRVVGGHHQ